MERPESRRNFVALPYQAIYQAVAVTVLAGIWVWLLVRDGGWIVSTLSVPLIVVIFVAGWTTGLFLFAGVGRRVRIEGSRVTIRRFVGTCSFDLERVAQVQRFDWNIDVAHLHDVWRLDVGHRWAVYVDERASGFAELRSALETSAVPIVVGGKTFFRSQLLNLEPAT